MPSAEKLSVVLPSDIVRVIRSKVAGGGYASNSDVVREALIGWIDQDRHFATLQAAVDRGIADADAGRVKSSEEVRRSVLEQLGLDGAPPRAWK